jgi:hypothetical protein
MANTEGAPDRFPDIDPQLISEIDEIEDGIRDSGSSYSLERQLFQEYYDQLSELNPEEVPFHRIVFEQDGERFEMSPIGDTEYGPLFDVMFINRDKVAVNGLFVFAGSLVSAIDITDFSADQKAFINAIARRETSESRTLINLKQGYAMFTQGVCDESYFVFFPVYLPTTVPEHTLLKGQQYSKRELYGLTTVRIRGTEDVISVFIAHEPSFSEEKIPTTEVSYSEINTGTTQFE